MSPKTPTAADLRDDLVVDGVDASKVDALVAAVITETLGLTDSTEAAYDAALACLVDDCTHDDVADCVIALDRLRGSAAAEGRDAALARSAAALVPCAWCEREGKPLAVCPHQPGGRK